MPDKETPVVRYRSLAEECRKAAKTLSTSDRKEVLEMAEEWDRLADQYAGSTLPFLQPGAPEQPVMQRQQQIQSKDNDKP
jgi:hypothetical protein